MTDDNLTILKSNHVLEMIRVAHEFCVFTEDISHRDFTEVLSFYQKILSLLYVKGSLLPAIEVSDEQFNERFVTEEHWENVFINLQTILGKEEVFTVIDQNQELQKASLAEHIADIYQDLKDFVVLFQNNRLAAKENALAELRRFFPVNWGLRITAAMPAIHQLYYAEALNEVDDELY
jgi:hypothetical protein